MQSSWGLASLSKCKGDYGSGIVVAEELSILKVQVPGDEQQEQKELESEVKQS